MVLYALTGEEHDNCEKLMPVNQFMHFI